MIGLNNVPFAGDEFEVVDSLDIARERAEERAISLREERILAKAGDGKITLSSFASAVTTGKNSGLDLHQLNVIMKVDLQVCIHTTTYCRKKYEVFLKNCQFLTYISYKVSFIFSFSKTDQRFYQNNFPKSLYLSKIGDFCRLFIVGKVKKNFISATILYFLPQKSDFA